MKPDLLSEVLAHPGQYPELSFSNWEILLGQARQSRLLSRLARHCADQNWLEHVPPGPRKYLEGALRLVDRQHHEVQWEVDCIRRALRELNTPVVLLKGAAYFMAGLPPRKGRTFSDIDIMVERKCLPDVEGALFRAGWIGEERDAYNERYYREWMHEIPPMRHVQRGTVIDVHHNISPPTSRFKVDSSILLARIEAIDERGDLFVLSPMDMVLNSAVHLFQEGEFGHGLRDLLDLKDLLEHFGKQDGFWERLFDCADELGLEIPLFHALFHIRRLFGFVAPAQWSERVEGLSPPVPARAVMGWMLGLALRPEHPSCKTRWTALARWLLYVRSHALRMPLQLVLLHLIRKTWMRHFPKKTTKP